jgi:hypothetical protein
VRNYFNQGDHMWRVEGVSDENPFRMQFAFNDKLRGWKSGSCRCNDSCW